MASAELQTATPGENISDFNNNASGAKTGKNYEKYSLRPRSIQNRIETEKRRKEPKKQPKPKTRAPPLSKYRRKTANARERGRMQDINTAFEALQRAVPQYPILPVNAQGKTCEKLTKITTLKLAMNYIRSLSQLLDPSATPSTSTTSSEAASTSSSNMADMDDFCSSGSSEFSPASSYTLSPLACSPPDCIQTVMRSFVLPTNVSTLRHNANVSTTTTTMSHNNNNIVVRPISYNSNSPMESTHLMMTLPQLPVTILPPMIPQHQQLRLPVSITLPKMTYRLPPTTVKFNTNLLSQSVSSLLAECSSGAGGSNRAGSLSSLTESDLSEYASDLLSDEGSTLDDPMFEDIIGVGTDDLDLLLESDGDSLHFSSDLSDN